MPYRNCGVIYFVRARMRDALAFGQVEDIKKENLDTQLWGRFCFKYTMKVCLMLLSKDPYNSKNRNELLAFSEFNSGFSLIFIGKYPFNLGKDCYK